MHSSGTERAQPNDPVRSVQVKFCLQTWSRNLQGAVNQNAIRPCRVTDRVQKLVPKIQCQRERCWGGQNTETRETCGSKQHRKWERHGENTHKHRSRAKPAMYSFLWALKSFMWMCSMATGLLLRSTFSATLYFLTSLNASVEAETKL